MESLTSLVFKESNEWKVSHKHTSKNLYIELFYNFSFVPFPKITKKKQWMRFRVERKIFQKKFVESDESDSYTWGTWDLGELQSTNCTISAMYIS